MKYLFFLLLSLSLISCTSESITGPGTGITSDFTYPDSTGNYWFYNYKNIVTNFSHDSIKHYFAQDTLKGSGISRFNGDTVINGIAYTIYSSEHIGGIHGQGHNTTEYYKNTDTGFVLHALKNTGTSFGPYNINPVVQYRISGEIFYTIKDLFVYFNERPSIDRLDSINFLSHPVNCIRYPAINSPQWYVYNVSDIYKVYRNYEGLEYIQLSSGLSSCVKISKKFYNFNTGTLDTNLVYSDHLSSGGVMKRNNRIKNIELYNNLGQLIGYFDALEEIDVINYVAN